MSGGDTPGLSGPPGGRAVGEAAAPRGAQVLAIEPLGGPVAATVTPPGSKSITNRALVVAALAEGTSTLTGVLDAEDTRAMVACLGSLGAGVSLDAGTATAEVTGVGGSLAPAPDAVRPLGLDARLSGTTARFVLALCALGAGPYRVDGAAPLRTRPMGGGVQALEALGVAVDPPGATTLPVVCSGGPVAGGRVSVGGAESSQFLSGLAMAGACFPGGLEIGVSGGLVSVPYVAMTVAVMRHFGAEVDHAADWSWLRVAPGGYRPAHLVVEADASAASYFLAAAALCGGEVRVEGVGGASLQGDVAFAGVLAGMGADVDVEPAAITLRGPVAPGGLSGITVDLGALSDTAPTLAVVAAGARGPTEVTGIGFIRAKESNRIAAVVTELRRLGVHARETPDGFRVEPAAGPLALREAAVRTYDDHRMAMAFTVLGLAAPGVHIVDPGCVDKTYPGFFDAVGDLRVASRGGR